MKRLNSTWLFLMMIGVSMISPGHSGFDYKINRSDSKDALDSEIVRIEALNVSLSLVENWRINKVKNPNAIEIQHLNSNSKVIIRATDSKELLYEIFSKANENEEIENNIQCMDSVSPDLLVKMVGEAASFPNGKVKISTESSITEGDFEVISVKTVINNLGFMVNGKLDQNCSACKSDLDFMIQSIEELQ